MLKSIAHRGLQNRLAISAIKKLDKIIIFVYKYTKGGNLSIKIFPGFVIIRVSDIKDNQKIIINKGT